MKELRFENLSSPEYYHEIEGVDSRIAIRKFLDARETMGFAKMSLTYAETSKPCESHEINFVRAIYIRHAIVDLNNSFDLLLQIPWMFYRGWSAFNHGGSLRGGQLKNRDEVNRNTNGWVYAAERECSYEKLSAFLSDKGNSIKSNIETFFNNYIVNASKPFTIRALSNIMKHNHVISFKELYEPYSFKFNLPQGTFRPKDFGMGIKCESSFYYKETPEDVAGVIEMFYDNDLRIDIKYTNGEDFFYNDCTNNDDRYSIDEIYDECRAFFDDLIDLFEIIYADIYPQIYPSMIMQSPTPKTSSDSNIDLNKYFIPLE